MSMAIELIGKTAPIPRELDKTIEDGFKKVELYMTEDFLTERHLKFLSDAKRESGIEFYSIHTPHSPEKNFLKILEKTKWFAEQAGIKVIVVHSEHVNVFSQKVLGRLGGDMFVENGHNHNLPFLEKIFKKGANICFDMAHFYVASLSSGRDYYDDVEVLFRKHSSSIGHVHIADATEDFAGQKLPISETVNYDTSVGEGEIDFFKALPPILKYYSGVAVVEVGGEKQLEDIRKLEKIISGIPRRKA